MGAGQSSERTPVPEEESESVDSSHAAGVSGTAAAQEPVPEAPAELPQCQMGNRKVDDMCFMISCTNWY